MVNTISTQTIHDGQKNLILQTDIIGDGSGDETATLLVDISSFASHPKRGAPTGCTIQSIKSVMEGFSARLLWDATTDVEAFLLGQTDIDMSFSQFGGLVNNAGTGITGDINLTTSGLGSGDTATIILCLNKQYG